MLCFEGVDWSGVDISKARNFELFNVLWRIWLGINVSRETLA